MIRVKFRDVEFTNDVANAGYGRAIHFTIPGDMQVELYQPHHEKSPR